MGESKPLPGFAQPLLQRSRSTDGGSSRDKKIKPWCEDCSVVVMLMRELSGVAFEDRRPDGSRPTNLDDLHRRHEEYGRQACESVAAHRAKLWLPSSGSPKTSMQEYYRPSTLFRPSHFGEYLASARAATTVRRCVSHGSESCSWCCKAHGAIDCRECGGGT